MLDTILDKSIKLLILLKNWIFNYKGMATIGSLLVIISSTRIWLEEPLKIKATAFSLHPLNLMISEKTGTKCFSLGIIFLTFGFLSLVVLYFGFHRLRFFLGLFCLLILLFFIAFNFLHNINKLEVILDGYRQMHQLRDFSYQYLAPNRISIPLPALNTGTDSLYQRFILFIFFGKIGIFSCLIGSLMILSGNYRRVMWKKYHWLKGWNILTSAIIILTAAILLPKLRSQYYLAKGDHYFNQAFYHLALKEYEKAGEINLGLFDSRIFWQKSGKSCYVLNYQHKSFYHYYLAEQFTKAHKYSEAIEELKIAMEKTEKKAVVKNALAWIHIQKGLWSFRKNYLQHSINAWQKALEIDSQQVQAHYYLAKAYYDSAQYFLALKENEIFIQHSLNNSLKANAYSNIGDCYNKLGYYTQARNAYLQSYYLDRDRNIRAYENLAGI